jgi:2-amino-4-hydroxy-6-hydroxymethyldihydropteridine diphosphokinase
MSQVFLSLGSNIDPAENIRKAIEFLCRHVRVTRISTVYLTPAEGRPEQPRYYNCVAEVETEIPPGELKYVILRRIEESLGRKRTADKFAARTIDLDIILYDDLIIKTDEITLPDPDIELRAFVALPLQELSPKLQLPGTGKSIADVAASLPEGGMTPLHQYTEMLRKEICRDERRES